MILRYQIDAGSLPDNLSLASPGPNLDPWGNPYQYVNYANGGIPRQGAFLVPLNTTFDLFSMGKDGLTQVPLTAAESWDDIVRGYDGAYVGLSSMY